MHSRVIPLVFLASACFCSHVLAQPQKPNIVIIVADDFGFSDLGCYGSEIKTPNLDKLAKNGLRFVQFYNTPRCCPSRAALMTGLYPHQTGIGNMTGDQKLPGYRGNLNDRCTTIAQVLRAQGYRTFMVGKNQDSHCKRRFLITTLGLAELLRQRDNDAFRSADVG